MGVACVDSRGFIAYRSLGRGGQQGVHIEALFQAIGDGVERCVNMLFVSQAGRRQDGDLLQISDAKRVAREKAVHVAARDAAIGRHRAVIALAKTQERLAGSSAGGPPHVHLVAAHRRTAGVGHAFDGAQRFFLTDDRFDVEKAKPGRFPAAPLHGIGVGDAVAKHLVAAADPQNMPAAPPVRAQINIPTLAAKMVQRGQGGFCARENDEIGIARKRRAIIDKTEIDSGFGDKRVEVVEIGDVQ